MVCVATAASRHRRPRRAVRSAAALASLVLAITACGGNGGDRGAAPVTRVEELTGPSRTRLADGSEAMVGDWLLENRHLRVVVGGMLRPASEQGVVLEARTTESQRDESLERLVPIAYVGGHRCPIAVTRIGRRPRDGRATLRIVGEVRCPRRGPLSYTRELTLAAGHAGIGIWSTIAPAAGEVDVRFATRIGWGGGSPWVPGAGQLVDATPRATSFVATQGAASGTVFGLVDAPLRVAADFETHGAARFLRGTEAVGPTARATRSSPAAERALLVVARGGMSDAVRRFGWLAGHPFPEAAAWLPYVPEGTVLRVTTSDGRPVELVRPAPSGAVVFPLPPVLDRPASAFTVRASAHGHVASDAVRFEPGQRMVIRIPVGGHARISVRDARTQAPIPARVRFVPIGRGPALDLGPDSSAHGARDTVTSVGADMVVPLAPGPYRVLVSHGPEWTLHDEAIVVPADVRADVHVELTHVVDPGDYVGCDLHVHAAPSPDSEVSLADRVSSLVAEGVDFAVPTDHNHVTDYAPSAATLGLPVGSFLTTPGVEVTTDEPGFGHFNAYPAPRIADAPHGGAPEWRGRTPTDLFAALRALGPEVVVQVNHPRLEGGVGYFDAAGYDPSTGSARGAYGDDYDLLEVWNGFDLARLPKLERVFGDWLAMIARGRHVTAVGNSDSHQVRYEWAGYPRTYVRARERTVEAILSGLRAGHAFVTDGPFLDARIGDAGPGDSARATNGTVRVHVRVAMPPWMDAERVELWMDGRKVSEGSLPLAAGHAGGRAQRRTTTTATVREATLQVSVTHDAGLVVLVRGDRTLDDYFARDAIVPLAFANPIWIDADGDAPSR